MDIVDRIKSLCVSHGITISYLERTLGLGNGTIRRWNDKTLPSADKLLKIAVYFTVTVEYLINGENDEVRAIARDMQDLDDSDKDILKKLIKSMREKGKEAQKE